jgi:hypothetical protein
MANMSPTTAAIASIAQHLAQACEAARGLDAMASQDLRSLLRIAGCEAERVRKSSRKAAASKKPAVKAAKQPAKRGRAVMAKATMQQQGKGRRRATTVNGMAH